MTQEFIPYEQALELKELGFDEPCLMKIWWLNSVHKDTKIPFEPHITINKQDIDFDYFISKQHPMDGFGTLELYVPTYSQALRWFREKYKLEGIPQCAEERVWYKFAIYQLYGDCKIMISAKLEYKTYEEAELECLKKLIQIVKENKQ